MKKIILTLFLILGLASFAAPKFVDTDKLQNVGYQITADDEDLFSFCLDMYGIPPIKFV